MALTQVQVGMIANGVEEILMPTNTSPANGATGILSQPTLTPSSFFTCYNGVTQSASQWQVSTSSTFATTVVNTGDDAINLATYQIGASVLSVSTTYYWRVRYKNSRGIYSDWSVGTSFVTNSTFRLAAAITISASTTNYVLNTSKVAGYISGLTDLILTINPGVTIGSTSISTYSFDVDTTWAAGDTIAITNNGTICGKGGNGGYGGGGPVPGENGGPGLRIQRAVSITNASGVVAGGGGGGGSAAACGGNCNYGGGGGGAGAEVGGAGATGGGGGCNITCDPGTATAGGLGYVSNGSYGRIANGYNGGARGAAGVSGCSTSGGAGGAATQGNSNITWVSTGTRLGALN